MSPNVLKRFLLGILVAASVAHAQQAPFDPSKFNCDTIQQQQKLEMYKSLLNNLQTYFNTSLADPARDLISIPTGSKYYRFCNAVVCKAEFEFNFSGRVAQARISFLRCVDSRSTEISVVTFTNSARSTVRELANCFKAP